MSKARAGDLFLFSHLPLCAHLPLTCPLLYPHQENGNFLKLLKVALSGLKYSGSKNCPNVWPF